LVPTSLGLILTTISTERRGQAIRIWAISGSLGAAAGVHPSRGPADPRSLRAQAVESPTSTWRQP